MIAQNPLLAKMSMFQEYQENSTIPLPSSPEDSDEEDFIKKMVSLGFLKVEFLNLSHRKT